MDDFFRTIIELILALAIQVFIIQIICLIFGLTWTAKTAWIILIADVVIVICKNITLINL